jgi:polyisoprenoid-binding protein YceI
MKRQTLIIGIGILIVLVGGGFWLYNWVLGDTLPASGPIQATPLSVDSPLSTGSNPASPTTAAPVQEATPTSTSIPATPAQAAASSQPTGAAASSNAAGVVYQFVKDQTQVSFQIHEELRGSPKEVVGTTNEIAGEVAVDFNDLSKSQVGVIQIDARTLVTDDRMRNQAIRNRILHTDQYEFITFTPTQISGLSGSAAPGQAFTFQIAGNLTIQDITQPVVFEVTGQIDSSNRLTGKATTTITRSAFNLEIPSVPFVANVGDEITIEINGVLAPK